MLHFLTGLRSLPVAAALAGGIFLIDTLSSLHFAVASLYIIVVLVAAHDLHRRGVVITGVAWAFLTVFGEPSFDPDCHYASALERFGRRSISRGADGAGACQPRRDDGPVDGLD